DGADPSPTLSQLKRWIRAGDLRYVLVSGGMSGGMGGGMGGGFGGSGGAGGSAGNSTTSAGSTNTTAIQAWVIANCKLTDYSGGSLYLCTPGNTLGN
ncbi:MAG: hypothetical protein RL243_761, partial [Actinomycetota bacterium]